MGPYYVTALVSLLGPVRRVTGSVRASFSERTAGHEAIRGLKLPVSVDTHVTGILDFASGPIATITTSFDVWAAELPRIEIYGTEGTLSCPDPNTFGGPVRVLRPGGEGWSEVPVLHSSTEPGRGTGVADMAYALRNNRPHRVSGALAYHVLDIMQTIHDASRESRHIDLSSTVERPAMLPLGPLEAGLAGT
jgi:predicted dehydrogenase